LAIGSVASGAAIPISMAIGAIVPLGQALITIGKGRKAFIRNSKVQYLVRLQNEANKAA
jgi:hypothetical protein